MKSSLVHVSQVQALKPVELVETLNEARAFLSEKEHFPGTERAYMPIDYGYSPHNYASFGNPNRCKLDRDPNGTAGSPLPLPRSGLSMQLLKGEIFICR